MHTHFYNTSKASDATKKASVMKSLCGEFFIINYYERNAHNHMRHKLRLENREGRQAANVIAKAMVA